MGVPCDQWQLTDVNRDYKVDSWYCGEIAEGVDRIVCSFLVLLITSDAAVIAFVC